MNKSQAKEKIQQLSKEIEQHNYNYYNLDQPTVSDTEYDLLLKELIALEEQFPELISPQSPSQRVGTKAPSGAKTVEHRTKMLSLDNTYSIDELKDWEKRVLKGLHDQDVEYIVELKIDGVSASLAYEKGNFVLGATRGDGQTGEDVTHNCKTIRSIPLTLHQSKDHPIPDLLEVRAEVYMDKRDFDAMNNQRKESGEVTFANPRNATSGSLKMLDSRVTAERNLRVFIHSFGSIEGGEAFETQSDFLEAVKAFGMVVNPHTKVFKTLDEVIKYCKEFEEKRESLSYDVDGVVIKVNSLAQQNSLGATLKSPRWAVSYKFPAYQATTSVQRIVVQVGRTGILTPVADLHPVACGGVTISRATLHNFDEVDRLQINEGDRVLVERAGDVIPKIVKVVESSGKASAFKVPKKCPECKSEVVRDDVGNVAYRCINPLCPKQIERGLMHFASRGAMDIEGLGESVVVQLLEKGLVKDYADIYFLKKEDLLDLDLFADKKAENLITAIANSKKQPLSRLIFGLGIANIGAKASSVLADHFQNMNGLLKANRLLLQEIHEVGEVMADSLVTALTQKSTQQLIAKLKKAGVNMKEPKAQLVSDKFKDKKFIFTGELEEMTRNEAGEWVKKMGGAVVSSVSKKTDFVVVGANPGSKYEKAMNLGLTILNEQQFKEMMNG